MDMHIGDSQVICLQPPICSCRAWQFGQDLILGTLVRPPTAIVGHEARILFALQREWLQSMLPQSVIEDLFFQGSRHLKQKFPFLQLGQITLSIFNSYGLMTQPLQKGHCLPPIRLNRTSLAKPSSNSLFSSRVRIPTF